MINLRRYLIAILLFSNANFAYSVERPDWLPTNWLYSAPLIAPEKRDHNVSHAQKDPTVVQFEGRWHVFMTVKLQGRSCIEYCAFSEWDNAHQSKRTLLEVSDSDYFCAPQVFYFRPHQCWYLVYQMGVPGQDKMWVAYSTTKTINDPLSWSKAKPMLDGGSKDPRTTGGLDYWIICDDTKAYLFLTSLNGKMWRLSTSLDTFPNSFTDCQVALEADVFEASHTYKIKDQQKYLTIIEQKGKRYFKAYVSDRLDGEWKPIADTAENPFAGWKNVKPQPGVAAWTNNISHGELLRVGYDQTPTVDVQNLRFLFQGMLQSEKQRKGYGAFTWRLGMLVPSNKVE